MGAPFPSAASVLCSTLPGVLHGLQLPQYKAWPGDYTWKPALGTAPGCLPQCNKNTTKESGLYSGPTSRGASEHEKAMAGVLLFKPVLACAWERTCREVTAHRPDGAGDMPGLSSVSRGVSHCVLLSLEGPPAAPSST